MCYLCDIKHTASQRRLFTFDSSAPGVNDSSPSTHGTDPDIGRPLSSVSRRRWLKQSTAAVAGLGTATWAAAQVDVGAPSVARNLVPAAQLEQAAGGQYQQMLAKARQKDSLADKDDAQLIQLRDIARTLLPHTKAWNERASVWQWEVNLIRSKELNAFCMPGGKIAFFTGILDRLKLTPDEIAMIMGHEMAHALREHARERLAKTQATGMGIAIGARLLGLGDLGHAAANLGAQLLTLKFSRDDESEADLVGLELAARGGFDPNAGASLWQKMSKATGQGDGSNESVLGKLANYGSTHPSAPNRIETLKANVPKVMNLYQQAIQGKTNR